MQSKYGVPKWLSDGRRNPVYTRLLSEAMHRKNPDKRKEYQRQWRRANAEKSAACSRRYRERHPERAKNALANYRERMRKEHPEVVAKWYRHTHLRHLYKMEPERYYEMMAMQKKRCAICRRLHVEEKGKRLQVDHHHQSGRIRGLLCQDCNAGIGCLRESPRILRAALKYLRET